MYTLLTLFSVCSRLGLGGGDWSGWKASDWRRAHCGWCHVTWQTLVQFCCCVNVFCKDSVFRHSYQPNRGRRCTRGRRGSAPEWDTRRDPFPSIASVCLLQSLSLLFQLLNPVSSCLHHFLALGKWVMALSGGYSWVRQIVMVTLNIKIGGNHGSRIRIENRVVHDWRFRVAQNLIL